MKNFLLITLFVIGSVASGVGVFYFVPKSDDRYRALENVIVGSNVATTNSPTAGPVATAKAEESTAHSQVNTAIVSESINPPLKLIFGGDVMLGRYVETQAKRNGGGSWLWTGVSEKIKAADFAMVNLESQIKTDATTTPADSLVLRGDPSLLPSLAEAGIDAVSLANNHVPDMGKEGMLETKQALFKAGILYAGSGETNTIAEAPLITKVKGQKLGIITATYGVNFDTPGVNYNVISKESLLRQIEVLKPQVDAVVLFLHWGTEYATAPSDSQVDLAHTFIDAGASLIIGAHPHVPQKIERYGGGLIAYSLGNLVFDQQQGNLRDGSGLLQVELSGTRVSDFSVSPYQIFSYARPVTVGDESAMGRAVRERFGL